MLQPPSLVTKPATTPSLPHVRGEPCSALQVKFEIESKIVQKFCGKLGSQRDELLTRTASLRGSNNSPPHPNKLQEDDVTNDPNCLAVNPK